MSKGSIDFFNPQNVFGLTGWVQQSDNFTNNQKSEEVVGQGADGNFDEKDIFNKLKEGDVTYKHFGLTGDTTVPAIGTVTTGVLITALKISYKPKDFVELTPTGHQSVTGAAHSDGDYRKYSPTPTFPSKRGVPRSLTGCFSMHEDDVGIPVLGVEYSLQADFEQPDTAEFTDGEFANAYEEVVITFAGQPSHDLTLSGTWYDATDRDGERSNTSSETFKITLRNRYTSEDAVA